MDISENCRRISAEKNYKVGRSLADNYKSRQNTANPNISRIFGSAGFFLFKNSARKSTMGQTARSLLLYERHQNVADAESAAVAFCLVGRVQQSAQITMHSLSTLSYIGRKYNDSVNYYTTSCYDSS